MLKLYKIIISIIFISFSQSVYSQFSSPVFEQITTKDGLPDTNILSILQDYLGYLWFGTMDGLVKYDGYSMEVYQNDENIPGRISSSYIKTIYEDKSNNLWLGTLRGLNKFDRTNETFIHYQRDPNDSATINSDIVTCIYEDNAGRFWVGTSRGLNLFDRSNGKFTSYYFNNKDLNPENSSVSKQIDVCINAILEDSISGDLLIGSDIDGLWKFNIEKKRFERYKLNIENSISKKIDKIQSLYLARDGNIWMSTVNLLLRLEPKPGKIKVYFEEKPLSEYPGIIANHEISSSVIEDSDGLILFRFYISNRGLICFNPKSGQFQEYLYDNVSSKSYSNNVLSYLYEDRTGIIWIGSWYDGIIKWDKRKNKFQRITSDPKNPNSLSDPKVYSIISDPKGFIWFCTAKALDRYDRAKREFKHYLANEPFIYEEKYSTYLDRNGYLWIGTVRRGLIRFDPVNESYQFYYNNSEDSLNFLNKYIRSLLQDRLGSLWIGTYGFGLYNMDHSTGKLTAYKNDPNDPQSLKQNEVNCLFQDRLGTIWVGINSGGLNKFDSKTQKFTNYKFSSITNIYEDNKGNLWVDPYRDGLSLFDPNKGKVITSYKQIDGLAHNKICSIIGDNANNIWISTQNGLSKFNTKTKTFRNFYKEDGLIDNGFRGKCAARSPGGTMYFGVNKAGIIYFHPDSIKDDPTSPQVIIKNLSLFNRPKEKLDFNGFISELKNIELPHDQNDLHFEYVGLHYSAPLKNIYKYILEGFDKVWVDAENIRTATYTNLEPGEYVFRVKAANKDGVWNEEGASLGIIILPPWWKTWWAYFLYSILSLTIFYYTWKMQLKRIRAKQEFEMSKFEAQKLHEVDEIKSRFFTNISHEFRTPLTLILGPVKQIIERTKETKTKEDLNLVHRNANRLLGLVNQLLDISKIESGNMKLQTTQINIIPYLKAIVLSFTSYAERKRIDLKFVSDADELMAYIDKDKFEKIINNLLSNAFKFTPDSGTIEVNVTHDVKNLNVAITDTGLGIPNEKMQKIFDRFYQVDGSHTREQEGTGIGLSLTKELVELHKGKIEVESEEGKGSSFIISSPLKSI